MKTHINKLIIVCLLIVTSCEDVVQVDLTTSKERLVIEALINWKNGTAGNEQVIKLSKTSPFYNNQVVPATGASIFVKNTNTLQVFNFSEVSNGMYKTTNFVPIINATYELQVEFNNEVYKATSTLLKAPIITEVNQSIEGGFNADDPEINVSFQDILNQTDFYRIVYKQFRPSTNENVENTYNLFDDQFEENNVLSDFFESDSIKVGDEFDIAVYSIPKRFSNFLEVLAEQSETSFGPFSFPPVNVKGNCVNTTNKENYPYGYFSLYETNNAFYTFQ